MFLENSCTFQSTEIILLNIYPLRRPRVQTIQTGHWGDFRKISNFCCILPVARALAMGLKMQLCYKFSWLIFICLTPFFQGYLGLISCIIVLKKFFLLNNGCFGNVKKTLFPARNYMFKVNNRNTRTRCEICSKFVKKKHQNDVMTSFWCFYY